MLRVIALAALLAFAVPAAAQQVPVPPNVPVVVTSGEAVVRRTPDVAYLTLAVESRARNPRDAQRENADAMSGVQKRLADAGVPREALRTIGLWLQQEFDNIGGRQVARGYVARNMLEVRIDDVGRAGDIADAVVQGGATSLNGIRFDLKDRGAAEREAIGAAVAEARGRAQAAAAGAGMMVDRVLRIEDARADVVVPRQMAFARAETASATAVEPGLLEISAHVTLTVSMK
jgi:uncharacterized protein YggE